jgi:hypothetical protein
MSDEFLDPADSPAEDLPDEVLDDEQIEDLPLDADPADVVDQRREVPLDDDRDLLLEGDPLVDDRGGLGGYEL